MIFLNSNPKFKEIKTDNYQFYYCGDFNIKIEDVIQKLVEGKFPSNLKGNFAFFFKDKNRTVLTVDHLPTINLFYGLGYSSHIFLSVSRKLRENNILFTPNYSIYGQLKIYFGGSVGEETTVNEIKRVLPGCYVEILPNGVTKSIQYRNIYSHSVNYSYSLEELSFALEDYILKSISNNEGNFGLLHSSGTDSNTILGLFRKLNLEKKCNLISIKGENEFNDEASYIKKITDHYNLTTNWHTVTHTGNSEEFKKYIDTDPSFHSAYHRTYSAFWTEPHILAKYHSIVNTNNKDCVIFTGEVGDQIFGSRYGKILLKYILQKPNYSVEEIAHLFINCDRTRFKQMNVKDDLFNNFVPPIIKKSQETAFNWFIDTWNKIETDDLVNKIELVLYMYKGSHRVYNYTQIADLKFSHPFSDSTVFDLVWTIPGNQKIGKNGNTRLLSFNLVKDYMINLPWTLSKTGVAVVQEELKFEIAKRKLENARNNMVS